MLEKKHIVICGSMSNYQEMLACQKKLERHYIPSIVPKEENDLIQRLSVEDFNVFKRDVSNQYLRKIREKNVIAILVVNSTKESIPNYIGANTFAEIAMAFCWRRRIFLLYDIFEGFRQGSERRDFA